VNMIMKIQIPYNVFGISLVSGWVLASQGLGGKKILKLNFCQLLKYYL
jgi:hypothetical protein